MPRFDLNTRVRAVRKDQLEDEKLSEIDFKSRRSEREDPAGSRAIKTLAGARWYEMEKVKEELKAMLPTLKPSEVRRLLYLQSEKIYTSFNREIFHNIILKNLRGETEGETAYFYSNSSLLALIFFYDLMIL